MSKTISLRCSGLQDRDVVLGVSKLVYWCGQMNIPISVSFPNITDVLLTFTNEEDHMLCSLKWDAFGGLLFCERSLNRILELPCQ